MIIIDGESFSLVFVTILAFFFQEFDHFIEGGSFSYLGRHYPFTVLVCSYINMYFLTNLAASLMTIKNLHFNYLESLGFKIVLSQVSDLSSRVVLFFF